jgi:hypothetical protein
MTDSNTKPSTEALEKIFAIDADNAIAAYGHDEVPEGAAGFSKESELAALATNWNTDKLVEIWNRLPGVTALKKFTNRQTAVKRIWAEVSHQESTKTKESEVPQRSIVRKTARKAKLSPSTQPKTKRERIIALLKRPEGATLKTIMSATGWQAHSVRGFISAQLTKKSALKVKSFKRDGERVYRIRS